ncbi:MAG: hypothetical protein DRQ89_12765 [Epsilonproteobacteria bacterium]|nr:MAG: hypothetical protein DRQ89_12765 [Campylobacterota bacterium]
MGNNSMLQSLKNKFLKEVGATKENFKIPLGSKVEDNITDYKGIVVSRTQYLTNCNVYGIRSTELKEGKPADIVYIDEPQLTVVNPEPVIKESRRTGGPTEAPKNTTEVG